MPTGRAERRSSSMTRRRLHHGNLGAAGNNQLFMPGADRHVVVEHISMVSSFGGAGAIGNEFNIYMGDNGSFGGMIDNGRRLQHGEGLVRTSFFHVGPAKPINVFMGDVGTANAAWINCWGYEGHVRSVLPEGHRYAGLQPFSFNARPTTPGTVVAYTAPRDCLILTVAVANIGGDANIQTHARVSSVPVYGWNAPIGRSGDTRGERTQVYDGQWFLAAGEAFNVDIMQAGNVNFYVSGVFI
jgi:hypothetical protein